MSVTEQPAETKAPTGPSAHAAAIAVVLFVFAAAGLVLLIFSFTTANTDFSVDGDTATTSSYAGEDQSP